LEGEEVASAFSRLQMLAFSAGDNYDVQARRLGATGWSGPSGKLPHHFSSTLIRGARTAPPRWGGDTLFWILLHLASPALLLLFDLWSRSWGMARLLDLCGVSPRPHPSEGVG